jgi:hypothetical protein
MWAMSQDFITPSISDNHLRRTMSQDIITPNVSDRTVLGGQHHMILSHQKAMEVVSNLFHVSRQLVTEITSSQRQQIP